MQLIHIILSVTLAVAVTGHGHHAKMSTTELKRRTDLSRTCSSQVAALNEKRWNRGAERRSLHFHTHTTVPDIIETPYYDVLQNDTCIVTPEVTSGPYFWPRSQTLRQDMTEGQPGVPLYLDIGVLDISTCEPLEGVLVDLWHCNATGSYSSFDALSPNVPFSELLVAKNVTNFTIGVTDLHTDNTTYLRGMWPTDVHGMMEMKTIFPGFYVGRSIHIHAQIHTNWIITDNGTAASDQTISTGQLYFPEHLSEEIMALDPYASHTQINRTLNSVDPFYSESTGNGYNPVMSIVPLDGHDVRNGMVAYITIGVDTTAIETLE